MLVDDAIVETIDLLDSDSENMLKEPINSIMNGKPFFCLKNLWLSNLSCNKTDIINSQTMQLAWHPINTILMMNMSL